MVCPLSFHCLVHITPQISWLLHWQRFEQYNVFFSLVVDFTAITPTQFEEVSVRTVPLVISRQLRCLLVLLGSVRSQ